MEKNGWIGTELERDLTAFQDFKRQWAEGTLPDDHPVVVKTTCWCRELAKRYGCPDRADDLRQEALIRLATSEYRGQAALGTYILSVVQRLNIAAWRQNGGKHRGELPEVEAVDEANRELVEKVIRALEEDEMVKTLFDTRNEVRRAVVQIILDAENQVGRRRIAEIASQTLGRPVTRHEVETVLKQLRDVLGQHSGYHKASAG